MKYNYIFIILLVLFTGCISTNNKSKATVVAYETDKNSVMWVMIDHGKDSGLICKINTGRWMEPKQNILGEKITIKYYVTSTYEIRGKILGNNDIYIHKSALKEYNFISLKNYNNLNN